jgi:peptide/nickel transport system permease protein
VNAAGPPDPDASSAIELSRRKAVPLEASLVRAGAVAAPYVTMTRIALGQLLVSRLARLGVLVLACWSMVAVFADVLASDLPVACRWHSVTYLMPNITRPAELARIDCQQMARSREPGDWIVPPLVPFGPTRPTSEADALLPPRWAGGHPLGTDALGRDVFARVVHGARTALSIGLGASLVLVAIGVLLGALAGFAGGVVDGLIARAIESLTAIPTLLLVLVALGLVPHATTGTLLWTIALTRWTDLARLVRAEVLLTLGQDYVTAARALGASPARTLVRHVLPNAIAPALVAGAFGVSAVIVLEASVDFLHMFLDLGGGHVTDAVASWGEAMGEAREYAGAWWLIAFPGGALLSTLLASSLVGEAARDALDPRLRHAAGQVITGT